MFNVCLDFNQVLFVFLRRSALEPYNKPMRIILFDLETLPNLPEALKVWPQLSQFPNKTLKATVSTIICAGWKVYGENKTHCINAWDFPKRWKKNVNDDLEVVKTIREVLVSADAVVTHNGRRFDWKFLQTRIAYHGLEPLPKIDHVDTKQLASSNLFSFNNRLGYLGEQFVGDTKLNHEGWDLWVKVHGDDEAAKKKMEKYCKQDVVLLEKIFKKLKPFATNIPNHNFVSLQYSGGKPVCPSCGSTRLVSNGYRYTKTRNYKRYQCKDCLTWSRTDASDKNPRTY